MDFEVWQLILVVLALLLSSFVQAAIGFASGLISVPLMILAGVELPVAVTITVLSSSVPNVWGIFRHRTAIDWTRARLPIVLRLASLPLGVALLFWIDQQWGHEKDRLRQLIGVVVLAVMALQWLFRVKPRETIPQVWTWIAFPASGILQGLLGIPGPPIVLWLIAHDWEPARNRAFLFLMFLVCLPLHVLLLIVVWPEHFVQGLVLCTMLLPTTGLGTWLGLKLGPRLSRTRLRLATYVLLIAIAVNAIFNPWG